MFVKEKWTDIDDLKGQSGSQNKGMVDFEAKQNLLGFFNLLLQIDKRNNPQNYQKPKNNEDNRNTNNPD